MIKANELRIGNLVEHDEFGICRVEMINRDSTLLAHGLFDTLVPNDLFIAIPLTPEILEKAGFEYVGQTTLSIDDVPVYFKFIKGEVGCYAFYLNKQVAVPCKHLHQLQNLYFALTNEELNIQL